MCRSKFKLSILDQSPAAESESGSDAIAHTIFLVQKAEALGYHRFWVAEHHNSPRHMGSSPEVLISHLLAKTDSIRIGSGGVMLQHYSPYKVAENFNVLASLCPGRVDLGIGRGPGGLPKTTTALQQGNDPGINSFEDKLIQLRQYIHDDIEPEHPLYGIKAKPLPEVPADLFLLGTSLSSAELAAHIGLPYVFAVFLNNDSELMNEALKHYSDNYHSNSASTAQPMLALPIIVAESETEAAQYASEIIIVRITLASGRTFTVFSIEAAEELGRQSNEEFTYEIQPGSVVHGTKDIVRKKINQIRASHPVEEIFAVTAIKSFEKRVRSYELLSEISWD
ncbi:MAG: LLM class flavin-dependent oxidoreductase [Chloroflexota bacterium]|nr:LLM class flavin-dependent oxidoreductase [Chloroflexota bacterium]